VFKLLILQRHEVLKMPICRVHRTPIVHGDGEYKAKLRAGRPNSESHGHESPRAFFVMDSKPTLMKTFLRGRSPGPECGRSSPTRWLQLGLLGGRWIRPQHGLASPQSPRVLGAPSGRSAAERL